MRLTGRTNNCPLANGTTVIVAECADCLNWIPTTCTACYVCAGKARKACKGVDARTWFGAQSFHGGR